MALPGLLNTANELANQLGLNTWQLQQGKYHGFLFHTIQNTADIINKNFNPVAGVYSATQSALGSVGVDFDVDAFDTPNTFPYGTNTQAMNMDNSPKKKYVINRLPNGIDNIQYLGFGGETINFNIILWGMSYDTIIRKLQQVYLSDQKYIGNKDFRVLYHPIYGSISKCHFLDYKITYTSEKWRAALISLYFYTEQPITTSATEAKPTLSTQITSILNAINAVNNAWGNLSYLISTFGNAGGGLSDGGSNPKSSSNLQGIQNLVTAQNKVLTTTSNQLIATQILVNNLSPSFNNPQLNTATPKVSNLDSLNYYINHFAPNDINNLLSLLYSENINTITSLKTLTSNQYYDTINNLNNNMSNINQLSQILLTSYYGNVISYEVPSDMSMYEICMLNNVDYESSLNKIIQLNKGTLYFLNKVNKGTLILLPNQGISYV